MHTKSFFYDLSGRLISQLDHRGLRTSYLYNSIGKLVETCRELIPTPLNAILLVAIKKNLPSTDWPINGN